MYQQNIEYTPELVKVIRTIYPVYRDIERTRTKFIDSPIEGAKVLEELAEKGLIDIQKEKDKLQHKFNEQTIELILNLHKEGLISLIK